MVITPIAFLFPCTPLDQKSNGVHGNKIKIKKAYLDLEELMNEEGRSCYRCLHYHLIIEQIPFLTRQQERVLCQGNSLALTNAGPIFSLGHSTRTKINALVTTAGVLTVLVWSAHILPTFIHILIKDKGNTHKVKD